METSAKGTVEHECKVERGGSAGKNKGIHEEDAPLITFSYGAYLYIDIPHK